MDIRVENHGTIASLTGLTPAGYYFLRYKLHSEPWQWLGTTLCVEPRYVETLIDAAAEHNLTVECV